MPSLRLSLTSICCLFLLTCAAVPQDALEKRLIADDVSALVQAARAEGDARNGARLFHRPALGCSTCHAAPNAPTAVGPDLTKPEPGTTPAHLVESILDPSRVIRTGFETTTLALADGKNLTGRVLEEDPDTIVLIDPASRDTRVVVRTQEVEARATSPTSLMPAGLANTLRTRQEFLDLARYVIEIAEGGPARAATLAPTASELAAPPLPAYELDLDHAGLIGEWNEASLARGEAIYTRVCANCHGTPERAGSLPSSPKFWADRLKNGSDPLSLYKTLTQGYGQMAAQTWMVPTEKYDVIHYLREAFFRPHNPQLYAHVDATYLSGLPSGVLRGPAPSQAEPWATMDYGPVLAGAIEVGSDGSNIAYKGLAVRLDDGPGGIARGRAWALYELDTMRLAAFWTGAGFIDWNSIQMNGRHEVHPRVVGRVWVANPDGPGWANPETGDFVDLRIQGRDGRRYGPLPRLWLRRLGRFQQGGRTVLAYNVGGCRILETPGLLEHEDEGASPIFTRTLEIAPRPRTLRMRVAPATTAVAVVGGPRTTLRVRDGEYELDIPPSEAANVITILHGGLQAHVDQAASSLAPPRPFESATPGPPLWAALLDTVVQPHGDRTGPFAAESLTLPNDNPWNALIRPTGFDFLDPDAALVCTWDGDVWRVSGLLDSAGRLRWQRVASGLFQPLGLKVIDKTAFVTCRDQIVKLRDLDGDHTVDYYECFNGDQQVTEHFHEFAMGLQADARGNLYYTKAARHALTPLVPQHGTLLRVSADGLRTDILATGFRAPNGVCLNDDGTFFLTDQEGHWIPKNRLNLVREGRFYGNMWSYTDLEDTSDDRVDPPVCFLTNVFDRSPAEPVRVPADARWGALRGSLLSLSYGYGKVFVAPYETVDGVTQGGMVELPIAQFPTGLVRGRFHPTTGDLYTCGMFAWAGNQTEPGGFYRIRPTERELCVPVRVHAFKDGLMLTFSTPLDPASVEASGFAFRTWSLRRSQRYGSHHHDERPRRVETAFMDPDGRTVRLTIADFAPTACYELNYALRTARGGEATGTLDGSVHRLGQRSPD